jgi:release factor glutamine methyltransferase
MPLLVQTVLKLGKEKLEEANISSNDARLLLQWVLKYNFTELINHYNSVMDQVEIERYWIAIEKRKKHYPLHYIINSQSFYGYDFYVDERVLIPRPETELLVELIIKHIEAMIDSGKKNIHILDLCTGSGCIILSIYKRFKEMCTMKANDLTLTCYATDLSDEAIQVAQINERILLKEPKVVWAQGDLFEALKVEQSTSLLNQRFDIIVSNPPYISPEEINTLEVEVKAYEPRGALDGGEDGMNFYRRIIKEATDWINIGGTIFFEIGHGQMELTKKILEDNGFSTIVGLNDLYERERIVHGIFLKES